jgi:hypothetical protein
VLIEEALYTLITDNAGVSTIVYDVVTGTNHIYPVTMPQFQKNRTLYPAVVLELAGRERHGTHDGPDGLVASRFAIYSLGKEYFTLKVLADKVRRAVNGKSAALAAIYEQHVKGVFLQDEFDDYVYDEVEQLSLYRVTMDLMIHHREELED